MKTIHLYGIPNCDSVKKARDWLTTNGHDYIFHDFKKEGVPADLLPGWLKSAGRDVLVNRKGPTWRKLDPAIQAGVVDDASAIGVMLAHSSVIKRPVIVWGDGAITVGYSPEKWGGTGKPAAPASNVP